MGGSKFARRGGNNVLWTDAHIRRAGMAIKPKLENGCNDVFVISLTALQAAVPHLDDLQMLLDYEIEASPETTS